MEVLGRAGRVKPFGAGWRKDRKAATTVIG